MSGARKAKICRHECPAVWVEGNGGWWRPVALVCCGCGRIVTMGEWDVPTPQELPADLAKFSYPDGAHLRIIAYVEDGKPLREDVKTAHDINAVRARMFYGLCP